MNFSNNYQFLLTLELKTDPLRYLLASEFKNVSNFLQSKITFH